MIKDLIYQYLEDKTKIQSEKNIDNVLHWSPTDYCRCLRSVFWKKINKEITNPPSIHTLLKWEMGTGIHYQLKELYKKMAKFYKKNPKDNFNFEYIEAEEEFIEVEWEGIKFVYQPDDIIKVNDILFLIENKTKYGQGIEMVKQFGVDPDYEIQLLLYLIFLLLKNINIDKGEFYYVATDSAYNQDFAYTKSSLMLKHKEFMQKRNEQIKKILKDIEHFYKTGKEIIPDKEGQINLKKMEDKGVSIIKSEFQYKNVKYKSYPCTWSQGKNKCAYFNHCWGDIISKMKDFNYYIGGEFIK